MQQRPHDAAGARPDPGEAVRAGAADQAHQQGLGLVVPVVSRSDAVGPHPRGGAAEERVALPVAGILQRDAAAPGRPRDVHALHVDRECERCGQLAAELLVSVGRRAQSVVEVRDAGQHEPALLRELAQQQRERDRVGPAGQCGNHPRAGRYELLAPHRLQDALVQG